MKRTIISNIPSDPQSLYNDARALSYDNWVSTRSQTSLKKRSSKHSLSNISYNNAFDIIKNNAPFWLIIKRNTSTASYWELSACNMKLVAEGKLYIWIKLDESNASELFKKYNLIVKNY